MDLSQFSKYCIILVLLPAVFTGFFPGKIIVIQAFCFYLFTFFYWVNNGNWKTNEFDCKIIFYILLVWSAIIYIRGFLNSNSFYDWINMGTGLFFICFLFPTLLYFSSLDNLKELIKGFFFFGLPLCAIMAFFPPSDGFMDFQHNMYFMLPFLFCFSILSLKYKLIVVISLILIACYNIDRRSCLINVAVVILVYVFYYFVKSKILRLSLNALLIITPILFVVMALTVHFNIFNEMSKNKGMKISMDSRTITTDSRTGIYLDVYNELKEKEAFLFGLGGNGKIKTSLVYNPNHNYRLIYKHGRGGTESGMLNNIQYGGLIGFIVYSILFIWASLKATGQSNNDFMMMMGTFIAFKYSYSFIEETIRPQGCSFYLLIWLGMCYNRYLRVMNNNLMQLYLKRIFV